MKQILLAALIAAMPLPAQTFISLDQLANKGLSTAQVGWVICVTAVGTSLSYGLCPPTPVPPLPHFYSDQAANLQQDCSWLVTNPLAGSMPDSNSIAVFANGLKLTATPTNSQGTVDYTLDPANPLHIIPSAATSLFWANCPTSANQGIVAWQIRVSFVVLK